MLWTSTRPRSPEGETWNKAQHAKRASNKCSHHHHLARAKTAAKHGLGQENCVHASTILGGISRDTVLIDAECPTALAGKYPDARPPSNPTVRLESIDANWPGNEYGKQGRMTRKKNLRVKNHKPNEHDTQNISKTISSRVSCPRKMCADAAPRNPRTSSSVESIV